MLYSHETDLFQPGYIRDFTHTIKDPEGSKIINNLSQLSKINMILLYYVINLKYIDWQTKRSSIKLENQ